MHSAHAGHSVLWGSTILGVQGLPGCHSSPSGPCHHLSAHQNPQLQLDLEGHRAALHGLGSALPCPASVCGSTVSQIHSKHFLCAERMMFCFPVNRRLSPKMPVSSWVQTAEGIRIAHDRVSDSTLHSLQSRHIKLPAIYPDINLRESFQCR